MKRSLPLFSVLITAILGTVWILGPGASPSPSSAQGGARLNGLHRGTVVNTNDPSASGRLEITIDRRAGFRAWAEPCAPFSAQGARGINIPPAGSSVWIEFEEGDPERPVWMGVAYGS